MTSLQFNCIAASPVAAPKAQGGASLSCDSSSPSPSYLRCHRSVSQSSRDSGRGWAVRRTQSQNITHIVAAKRAGGDKLTARKAPEEKVYPPMPTAADYNDGLERPWLAESEFWEGEGLMDVIGFVARWLPLIGVLVGLLGAGYAVSSYNEGATDYRATPEYKAGIEGQIIEQPGDSPVDSSEIAPPVFDSS